MDRRLLRSCYPHHCGHYCSRARSVIETGSRQRCPKTLGCSILPADGSGRPLPARLFTNGWLRAETNLGGPVVDFSNLGITSLVPGEVTHALCRNDREWYERQPLTTKVANVRLPDHLYFIVAGIEAQVSFNFTVSQRLPLGGPLHIANGAGNATLRGFLGMDVDGGAIGRCEGSLGVQPWSISQLHVFGVGFSDAFVRAAVGAVLPLLVGEIPELLCRGEASTVSARIVDETGRARAFGGLPELANAKLTPVLAPLRALDLVVGPDHLKRARRDRERLAQVGVETTLGQGRFFRDGLRGIRVRCIAIYC